MGRQRGGWTREYDIDHGEGSKTSSHPPHGMI